MVWLILENLTHLESTGAFPNKSPKEVEPNQGREDETF